MYNNEIYDKLVQEFGLGKMASICYIISTYQNIRFSSSKTLDVLDEFDYERDWWLNKHEELIKLKEVNV